MRIKSSCDLIGADPPRGSLFQGMKLVINALAHSIKDMITKNAG